MIQTRAGRRSEFLLNDLFFRAPGERRIIPAAAIARNRQLKP
jgi:hypothetical protein